MVLLIIIPIKWLFHWEYTLFSGGKSHENPIKPPFSYGFPMVFLWFLGSWVPAFVSREKTEAARAEYMRIFPILNLP